MVNASLATRLLMIVTKVGIIASLIDPAAFIIISDYADRLGSRYLMDATKRLWRVYFSKPQHSPAANAAILVCEIAIFILLLRVLDNSPTATVNFLSLSRN